MNFFFRGGDPTEPRLGRMLFTGILAVVLIVFVFGGWVVVPAGSVGVKQTLGKVSSASLSNGLHFKWPIAQSVKLINVQTQLSAADASAAAKDLNTAKTQVSTNYHVDPAKAAILYSNIGVDYERTIISPAIQEVVKATTSKFTAEELVTKRDLVKLEITNVLRERLARSYLIVDEVSMTDFDFSPEFNAAIEAKVKAEQDALASKNKLAQVEYEAQQTVATAKAQAESIRIQGEALAKNPALVQLKWVEKWNGQQPTTMLGNSTALIQIPN